MKHLSITIFLLFAINAFGQPEKANSVELLTTERSPKDSIPKVVYGGHPDPSEHIAIFINNKFVGSAALTIFDPLKSDPSKITDLKVLKETIEIESSIYTSQIRITAKDDFFPKLISLNALKAKYTNLSQQNTIITIDNKLINADYDKFMIAESHILSISIEKTDKIKGGDDLNLMKILTRSNNMQNNPRKPGEIRIRGAR
jgi:hypothetical protein